MKTKHVFWGMFFISLGLLVLLNNLGTLHYDWSNIWKYWPLVFVIWGISFLSSNTVIKGFLSASAAIILAVTIFAMFKVAFGFADNDIYIDDHGISITDNDNISIAHYSQEYSPGIKNSEFNFEAGAGSFKMDDTTSQLIYATAKGRHNNYELTRSDSRNNTIINLKMKRKRFMLFDGNIKNRMNIKLNPNPTWDMNFDVGAASIDFDLSPYKTENVSVDMGAASLKIKLGDKNDNTYFHLKAGVSSIELLVPESSGCEIRTNGALSSKSFNNFNKISSGLYRTDNFDSSSKKIILDFDTGVSSLKVVRYNKW